MIDEIKMRSKKSGGSPKRKNDKPFASDCMIDVTNHNHIIDTFIFFSFKKNNTVTLKIKIKTWSTVDDVKITCRI
jgi:hypothetical protein